MRPTSCFPYRIFARAAACALLALSALAAPSQDASKPDTHGIAIENMDPSVKPGDNFYEYANGGWIKRTEIPPTAAELASSRLSTT